MCILRRQSVVCMIEAKNQGINCKPMKNIKILLGCVLAACALSACNDEEKIAMTGSVKLALLTDSMQLLESAPQLINIKFQGSEAWEVVDADSLDSWCAVYPLAGDAGSRKAVSVTLPPNDTYSDRSATIVIRSGGEEVTTRVVQTPYHVMMQWNVLPGGSYEGKKISANGDSFGWRIELYCKGDWTIASKDEWVMIKGTGNPSAADLEGGTGNLTLHIYAKPNKSGADRNGYFTVKSKTTEAKVRVVQAG